MKLYALFLSFAIMVSCQIYAESKLQPSDSTKNFKNTIRVNITNPALLGDKNYVFGYERVIKDYQTFSINAGLLTLPKSNRINYDSIALDNEYTDKGFSIAADYRFYLQKENKYKAPRGVYIGPYYAFHYYNRQNIWSLETASTSEKVKTDTKITMNFVGAQLGYQFIIRDRFSIDLILMGPGLWFYKINTAFETSLPEDDEILVLESLFEMLESAFPGSDFLIEDNKIEAKKTTTTSSMGFRYLINLGFRF